MKEPEQELPVVDGIRTLPGMFREGEQITLTPTPRNSGEFMHRHEDIEISYLLCGKVNMKLEERSFLMEPGDFLVLDTNYAHSPELLEDDTLLIAISVKQSFFDEAFFQRFYRKDDITSFFAKAVYSGKSVKRCLHYQAPQSAVFQSIVESMLKEYYAPTICSQEFIESYMMIFFAEMLRVHAMAPEQAVLQESAGEFPQLNNIIGYINAHLSDVSRSDLAAEFGYSYSYITKVVRDTVGCTFTELRHTLRLQRVEKLLLTTELPIAEIASISGFHSVSDFYRQFRQKYQLTPQEYRAQFARSL